MEPLETLVQTNQLKMTYLQKMAQDKNQQLVAKYDNELDELRIAFETNDLDVVVHYVDDYVALLYLADTLEIIGLHIEDFALGFLPAHKNVARLWQLKETGEAVSEGEIMFYATKTSVAKEVAKATEPVLGEQAQELAAAFG